MAGFLSYCGAWFNNFSENWLPNWSDAGVVIQRRISPENKMWRSWQTLIDVLSLYVASLASFEIAFLSQRGPPWPVISVSHAISCLLLIDIILTFFVAYRDATYQLVRAPMKIFTNYAKFWLWADVISALPVAELARKLIWTKVQPNYASYVCLLRLCRIPRVASLFSRLEIDVNFFLFRCLRMAFVTLFTVHVCGCFYYHLAEIHLKPADTWIGASSLGHDFISRSIWSRYWTSSYYSMTTMTTVGFGDLHPINITEMIWTVFFMLLKLGIGGYVAQNLGNLFTHDDTLAKRLIAVNRFAKRNHLNPARKDLMITRQHLRIKFESERLFREDDDYASSRALHRATSEGMFDFVRFLLECGADPNCRDGEGNVPMWIAIRQRHEDIVQILEDYGATIHNGDVGGFFCEAARRGDLNLVKRLQDLGGDITRPGRDGETAASIMWDNDHRNIQ